MSWTGRADDVPCCGAVPGAVDPAEDVARLLHSKITVPDGLPFTRQELTWYGRKEPFENACGTADGASLERSSKLADDEIRRRAQALASNRSGRSSEGAIVARVAELRKIKTPDESAMQAVFVYDDPREDNREHAVMRVSQGLSRAAFDYIRSQIENAFGSRKVRA